MHEPINDISLYTEVAIRAADKAGVILRDGLQGEVEVFYKADFNLVTHIDRQSEALIVSEIHNTFPSHQIMAEEGHNRTGASPYRWIIDPLDGTTNYAHRFPFFCISIALEREGEVIMGLVYDPVREERFLAERGKGGFLNGKSIAVSSVDSLSKSLLVTGFSYDIRTTSDNNFNHFIHFSLKAQAVRRTGSAALDLCYVATGRFDGFWEMKLNPWDTAAGSLILTEAGGTVTDFSGKPYSIDDPHILATNGRLHPEMVKILNT